MHLYLVVFFTGALVAAEYMAPAGERPAVPRPGAVTVLPGGRLLQPVGRQYSTGTTPFGLAVRDRYIVTANGGPDEFSISILRKDDDARYHQRELVAPREGTPEGKPETWRGVSDGVIFGEGSELFIAEGNSGRVRRIDLNSPRKAELYELNRDSFQQSYTGELAYDARRRLLYIIDQANFRVAIADLRARRISASVAVGRLPFALALAPDGKRLYVANLGMFTYKLLPGASAAEPDATGLPFPAFGFPSLDSLKRARRERSGGAVDVPPLGDPNSEQSNSLCIVNVEDAARPRVEGFVRTGKPVGAGVHGGSSPSAVLATAERIFVANAHNDSISVIDARTLKVTQEIELRIPRFEGLRGILPVSLALHEASGWLLVAEAGINAVGVIDTKTLTVLGHIPAAWYPAAVRVLQDDVFVANVKGHGTGATANRMVGFSERFQEPRFRGSVTVFPLPDQRDLGMLTQRVMQLNGFAPLRNAPAAEYLREIRHVVLIIKESRSFDEVFGDIEHSANGPVDGAPMLARFGRYGSAGEGTAGFQPRFALRGINVTPNHHAMAARWSMSDNFYSDSGTSVGGHHWLNGVPPNAWTLSTAIAGSGGQKSFSLAAPGRLLFAGRNASVHPEEVPEAGTLWHHLERNRIDFRNFGEGFDLAGVRQDQPYKPAGARFFTNVPMLEPLMGNSSRNYPGYNINIPDQVRAGRFILEIEEFYAKPGKPLPQFVSIYLPNDDMGVPRAEDGYPFSASFVADNDYALGRIVEYLSRSPWWKNMAIFVTEDGAHGGVDHVDSHRTVLLAIGPYLKRNYVSHRNTSFPGLLKTIFRILGLPPLHLFDAAATDLSDCFSTEADFSPYEAQPVQQDLFDPAQAIAAFERQ
jgi:YVTN family beta-propeller protein